jgi:glycolate oxidase FAD binding subunit
MRGSEATRAALPVFQPEAAPVAALSAGLRAKFDPRGVLNPGLMG